jgi:Lon protease-like protein
MRDAVSVNFKKSFPLFPLPETALLPHTIVPLSVSEPRFRQLVDHALDGSGQIAIATLEAIDDAAPLSQSPNVRPAVCLGQVVQHDSTSYGYNILVYGLCRATIKQQQNPTKEHAYSSVSLKPTETSKEHDLEAQRDELYQILQRPNLQRLERLEALEYWLDQKEITTPALFELIGGSLLDDAEFRYELLAEPSCERRTMRILSELHHIDQLLSMSNLQSQKRWNKGVSWN